MTSSREEELFAAALAMTPEACAEFLDRECQGDSVLRARVLELLAAYDNAPSYIDRPVVEPLAAEKPGDRIDRYKLLQKIGEGGCGVVWMAEQEKPVRRRVALKITKLGTDTAEVLARFEAERQALALMDHPGIARVFDGGATPTGRPYFVMELVRGIRITDFCDQQNLSTRARLELFTSVCHTVQHAHQKGIIHRDLKPSNILVTVNDGVPVPKVIDFGIAKATQGRLTDRTLFTAFEQFIGTPAYMSPEQAELTSLDVDTRSDIYSLGVLLYELLTGRTPFDTKSLLQAGLDEVRRVIREVEPPRPSRRLATLGHVDRTTIAKLRATAPAQLTTQLSGDLDWIVMRCLEKDRRRRYETANGLALDLQRHLNDEPVLARPPSAFYRVQKMVRRNRLAFAAVTAVVVALVLGLALATWRYLHEREARAAEAAARAEATTEARKREQVAQFLTDMLKGVGPSVALGRDTTLLREILDRTVTRVAEDLKGQPEIAAELQVTIAEVYGELGDNEKSHDLLQSASATLQKAYGNAHPLTARALTGLGSTLLMEGKPAEAEALIRDTLAVRRKIFGNEHREVAEALILLGGCSMLQGRLDEWEAFVREALAILRKLPVDDDQQSALSNCLNMLSVVAMRQSDYTAAESLSREIIAIQRKLASSGNPFQLANQLDILAGILDYLGQPTEAEASIREALELNRRLLGSEHPWTAKSLANLSSGLIVRGRLDEAETAIREAIAITHKSTGGDSSKLAWQTGRLGAVRLAKGDFVGAESILRDALRMYAPPAESTQDDAVVIQCDLGEALRRQGKTVEAEKILREALAALEPKTPTGAPNTGNLVDVLTNLGAILRQRGDHHEAETMLRVAVTLQAELPLVSFARKAQAHLELARLLILHRDLAGAENSLLAAQNIVQTTPYSPSLGLRRDIVGSLVGLYESWARTDPAKSDLAAEWRHIFTQLN